MAVADTTDKMLTLNEEEVTVGELLVTEVEKNTLAVKSVQTETSETQNSVKELDNTIDNQTDVQAVQTENWLAEIQNKADEQTNVSKLIVEQGNEQNSSLTEIKDQTKPPDEDKPIEKPTFWLRRLFEQESDTQRRLREEKREADRNKPDGGPPEADPGKPKGKGIFGMLGSMMKVMGGGLMKVLGPLFKVLKIVFKVLKFTALGFALIAAGIFFSMSDADQQTTIDTVVNFFKKVGKVLSAMGKAFGGAFMKTMDDAVDSEGNPIEGLISKFAKFKKAWSDVLQKLSGISMKVGGKTYKGLEGFADMMGDLFGKIAGWFLDLGTGIAELITDPALVWLKMKIAVSNFFGGIGDTLGRFADKFLNMEFFYSLLPDWAQTLAREAGWMEDASKERAQDKLDEMKKLSDREKVLAKREVLVKKKFDEQQAKVDAIDAQLNNDKITLSDAARKKLEAEKEVEDQKRLNAMAMVLETKNERERNIERFEYAKESYESSTESAIIERANAIVKEKAGIDVIQIEKDIAEHKETRRELRTEKFEGELTDNEIEATMSTFEALRDIVGGTRLTKDQLTPELIAKIAMETKITGSQAESVALLNDFLQAGLKQEGLIAGQDKDIQDIKDRNQKKIDRLLPDAKAQARKEYEAEQGQAPVTLPTPTRQVDPNKPVKVEQPDANKPRPKWKEGLSDDELRKKYELSGAQKLTSKAIRNAKKKLGIGTPVSVTNVKDDVASFTGLLSGFAVGGVFDLKEQDEAFGIIEKSMEKDDLRNVLWNSGLVGMIPKVGRGTAPTAQKNWEKKVRNLQEGGLVTETGLAMLHGSVPKPELVLDNQAAALFMKAANTLSGMQLMNLQREQSAGLGEQKVGAAISVVNNSSQQINQNQAMILPPSPIEPGNSDNARLLN